MPTIDNNIKKANETFEERQAERESAGGGRALSPADAAGMGASPDQAKMVGATRPTALKDAMLQAKAQKELAQEEMLSAIQREKSFEDSEKTDDQRSAEDLAEKMKGLQSFDGIVNTIVNDSFESTEDATGTEGIIDATTNMMFELDEAQLKTFLDDSELSEDEYESAKGEIASIFSSLSETPPDMSTAGDKLRVMQEDGILGSSTDITMLLPLLMDTGMAGAETLVAHTIAEGIVDPGELTMDWIIDKGFIADWPTDKKTPISALGDMTIEDLEEVLGTEYLTMTPNDISNIVSNTVLTEIHQTENLLNQIDNPNVSPMLKEHLRERVSRIEASGFAAVEQDASQIGEKVAAAGSVLFGGKVQKIETLLDDTNIVAMITEYLSEEDPDKRKKSEFFKDNLYFATFVDTTMAAAMDMSEDIEQGVQEFSELQEENKTWIADTTHDITTYAVDISNNEILLDILNLDPDTIVSSMPEGGDLLTTALQNKSVLQSLNSWGEEALLEFKTYWAEVYQPGKEKEMKELLDLLSDPDSAMAIAHINDSVSLINSVDKGDESGLIELLLGYGDSRVSESGFDLSMFTTLGPGGVSINTFMDKILLENPANSSIVKTMQEHFGPGENGKPIKTSEEFRARLLKFMKPGSMKENMENASFIAELRNTIERGAGVEGEAAEMRDELLTKGIYNNGSWDFKKLGSFFRTAGDSEASANKVNDLLNSGLDLSREFKTPVNGKLTKMTVKEYLIRQQTDFANKHIKTQPAAVELDTLYEKAINKIKLTKYKKSVNGTESYRKKVSGIREDLSTHINTLKKSLKSWKGVNRRALENKIKEYEDKINDLLPTPEKLQAHEDKSFDKYFSGNSRWDHVSRVPKKYRKKWLEWKKKEDIKNAAKGVVKARTS